MILPSEEDVRGIARDVVLVGSVLFKNRRLD